ncbi:unnamed protein product [Phaeothamnion confervicola]
MGLFKQLTSALGFKKGHARILVIGLDNSGKTTLIHHVKPKKAETFEVTPTVGFQMEEFEKNRLRFTIFDMSGQSRYRTLWEHYYREADAVLFVLDSTDAIRMCVAREELDQLLAHPDLQGPSPILFFANKMDLPGAMTPVQIMGALELERIKNKPWHIAASNAVTGEGIDAAMSWLAERLTRYK